MKRLIIILILLVAGMSVQAQQVRQQGNNFEQVSKGAGEGKETKTQYTYTIKGQVYPVYLSSRGKAFIKRVSAKTGKEYKQYVPEIGKRINPKAYQEK